MCPIICFPCFLRLEWHPYHYCIVISMENIQTSYISSFYQFRPIQLRPSMPCEPSSFASCSIGKEEVGFRQLLPKSHCIGEQTPRRVLPDHVNLNLFMQRVNHYLSYISSKFTIFMSMKQPHSVTLYFE